MCTYNKWSSPVVDYSKKCYYYIQTEEKFMKNTDVDHDKM